MPIRKKGASRKSTLKQCIQFDEAGERWCVKVYGKRFYFGRSNYPDTDSAKIAALAFMDNLPQKVL